MYVGKPTANEDYTNVPITPQQARLRDMTYSAEISVDVEYSRGRVRSFAFRVLTLAELLWNALPPALACCSWVIPQPAAQHTAL